jgi:tetratricopeptide (TPR) repeat protein
MTEESKKDEEVLREFASELIEAHQWQKARLVAQHLISIAPKDPLAHAALGMAWLGLNELDEAEQCFRRVLDLRGDSVEILLHMASLCAYRGDFGGQLEWALRAAQCDEEDPEPHLAVADAQIRLGHLTDAETALKSIIEVDPDSIRAHRMLGHVYLSLQKADDAAHEFRTALRHDFSDAALWTNLGHTLSLKEEYVDALAAFLRALHLEPDDTELAYNVGDAYLALDQPEKAIRFLTKAVKRDPDFAPGYYDLGLAFFELGRYEESAIASMASLRSDPDMVNQRTNLGMGTTTNLGLAYMNLGKYAEAEECFRRNLRLSASTYFNLGLTLFKRGRYEESLRDFQRALEIKPQDPEYLDLLGNAYAELGQLDEALKTLQTAIAVDDTYALAYYDMGTVLARMKGKEAAAVRSFKRAVTLDADLFWAYYGIGCLYARQGKKELALRFLHKAFQNGFGDMAYLDKDSDWEALRNDQQFQELKHKYTPGT